MTCRLLIAARDMAIPKGSPGTVRDYHPTVPGSPEQLPNWVSVIFTDCDKEEIKALNLRQQWFIEYKHEILNQNDLGYRIKTSVDDEFLDASGIAANVMKTKMMEFLQTEAGATSITFTTSSVTYNIAKPADLPKLKSVFADKWNTVFSPRKLCFSESDVDAVIAMGGEIELTKAQFLNKLRNKLDY